MKKTLMKYTQDIEMISSNISNKQEIFKKATKLRSEYRNEIKKLQLEFDNNESSFQQSYDEIKKKLDLQVKQTMNIYFTCNWFLILLVLHLICVCRKNK